MKLTTTWFCIIVLHKGQRWRFLTGDKNNISFTEPPLTAHESLTEYEKRLMKSQVSQGVGAATAVWSGQVKVDVALIREVRGCVQLNISLWRKYSARAGGHHIPNRSYYEKKEVIMIHVTDKRTRRMLVLTESAVPPLPLTVYVREKEKKKKRQLIRLDLEKKRQECSGNIWSQTQHCEEDKIKSFLSLLVL